MNAETHLRIEMQQFAAQRFHGPSMITALLGAVGLALQLPRLPIGSPIWSHRARTRQAARAAPLCAASGTSTPVFVSNVAWEASLVELSSLFDSRFGRIEEAWLAPDRRGINHAGLGKIIFAQPAQHTSQTRARHGQPLSLGVYLLS